MSSEEPKIVDPKYAVQVTQEMVYAVSAKAKDGRITCAVLRRFAEDQGVTYRVAGAAADAAGIRVNNCELGCF